MTDREILELKNVKKFFSQQTGLRKLISRDQEHIQAVDGITLTLSEGEIEGIIGESGCGKSTLLMVLMGLYEPSDGEILYKGRPLSTFDKGDWKEFRRNVQIILQDPFNSLDPKLSVRESVREPLEIHGFGDKERRVKEALELAELQPPEDYIDNLPKQLSGGEKQRVSIARAIVVEPDIILADEPVSMLDVSTQAALLRLLSNLGENLGVSMVYVSHDLSTVGYLCNNINVMYLGRIVENGPTTEVLENPKHPYSQALINAIPIPDPHYNRARTEMYGSPRDPVGLGDGCRFRDRCPERMEICEQTPHFVNVDGQVNVACHLHYDHEEYENNSKSSDVTGEMI